LHCARTIAFTPLRTSPRNARFAMPIKAETLLAQLREQYKEWEDDKDSIEFKALYHAFCFVSYKVGDFQKYLNEVTKKDEE
jgi:hypothetical protein